MADLRRREVEHEVVAHGVQEHEDGPAQAEHAHAEHPEPAADMTRPGDRAHVIRHLVRVGGAWR